MKRKKRKGETIPFFLFCWEQTNPAIGWWDRSVDSPLFVCVCVCACLSKYCRWWCNAFVQKTSFISLCIQLSVIKGVLGPCYSFSFHYSTIQTSMIPTRRFGFFWFLLVFRFIFRLYITRKTRPEDFWIYYAILLSFYLTNHFRRRLFVSTNFLYCSLWLVFFCSKMLCTELTVFVHSPQYYVRQVYKTKQKKKTKETKNNNNTTSI